MLRTVTLVRLLAKKHETSAYNSARQQRHLMQTVRGKRPSLGETRQLLSVKAGLCGHLECVECVTDWPHKPLIPWAV